MTMFKGENPYIYGLHDPGGEHLMIVKDEAKGWVLVTEAIGSEPNERGGGDYSGITKQGLGLLVRLNQSYGPNGTIPREARYPEFAQRAANFVRDSKGANIWIIGNEMNFEREQPRKPNSNQAEPITPRRYAECYKLCRQRIKAVPGHENDLVIVGAIGPWNGQTPYEADPQGKYPANKLPGAPNEYPYFGFYGDYILYLRDILLAIGPENCDGIAIHAYSHGYKPEMVFDQSKMGSPFEKYYFNFLTYRDQMNAIPAAFRHLPVYLTEANGDREGQGHDAPTWPFGNNGWIKNAYKEIDSWNKGRNQQIRCMILFRWQKDPLGWSIDGKPEVQQDFKDAIAKNYKWDPDFVWQAAPTKPGYRVRYLQHTTPKTLEAGQSVDVILTVENAGSFTWLADGDKPFRLGFQWYNAEGQYMTLPAGQDARTVLARPVAPGESIQLRARLNAPAQTGAYQMRWDMVHEQVTWFSSQGDPGLVLPITVTVATTDKKTTGPRGPVTITAQDVTALLMQHPARRYPMRTHADIGRIILHHTATQANITVQRIAEFQVKNRDLPGITYHYCVTAAGDVFQTQYLETVAAHAGAHSQDSVGVCLIGDFTSEPPPQLQLDAAAILLAQLAAQLGLSADQIFGYSEIVTTGSPGATWPTWKKPLLDSVRRLMAGDGTGVTPPPTDGKIIDHYLLLWHRGPGNWAEWDLQGAMDYIDRFRPTIGFDIEQAKAARYVTIVGGTAGVAPNAERILRAAGCQVERIAGASESETRRMLQELAAKGQRFRDLK